MARIMPALETNHDVGLLRQPVDHLPLALVPPLGADNDHIGHELPLSPACRSRESSRIEGGLPANPGCRNNGSGFLRQGAPATAAPRPDGLSGWFLGSIGLSRRGYQTQRIGSR